MRWQPLVGLLALSLSSAALAAEPVLDLDAIPLPPGGESNAPPPPVEVPAAESPTAPRAERRDDAPATRAKRASSGASTRQDPRGVTGISPYWELLQAGDRAFVARQFSDALGAYQDAIREEPQAPLAHYRAGEAALAAGQLDVARASWEAGLRYAKEPAMKAKLLFVLADVEERARATSAAISAWKTFKSFAEGEPSLAAMAAVAAERIERLETWLRLQEQYAVVRERIAAPPPKAK